MEFRRINGLPPYVFAVINQLRDEARRAGRGRHRPGFRQPGHPEPAGGRRETGGGGPQPPQPPLLVVPRGIPNLRLAVANLYMRRYGVGARPRHGGRVHDRGQGGAVASDVGPARPGRHALWCRPRRTRSTSTRRCSPEPTSSRCGSGPARTSSPTWWRLGGGVAAAEGDRVFVPPQPDDGVRGPGVDAEDRRLRPDTRDRAGARFRLFGHVFDGYEPPRSSRSPAAKRWPSSSTR